MSLIPYLERSRGLFRELLVHRVADQHRRVVEAVWVQSWACGAEAASISDISVLAQAAQMDIGDCSRAIGEMREMKLLRVERLGGRWWLELQANSAAWIERGPTRSAASGQATSKQGRKSRGISKRVPSEDAIALSRRAWKSLDADGDPAQQTLPIGAELSHPPLGDGGLSDAMAATNRDQANAHLGNSQTAASTGGANNERLGNSQLSGHFPKPGDLGNSQTTHAGARAPNHVHEHVPPSVPQSMVHDGHARRVAGEEDRFAGMSEADLEPLLDPEGAHWDEQLPEIFGPEATKFRLTWMKRFCDRWNGCAYRAIGEIKRMQVAGESFKKGPGQYANYLFNQYRYASLKRSKEAKKS